MNIEHIAQICYEADLLYTGDKFKLHWVDASNKLRNYTIDCVNFCLANPNATASEFHESRRVYPTYNGWDIYPRYEELTSEQQIRCLLFLNIVKALRYGL